jgi:hypothetical protein
MFLRFTRMASLLALFAVTGGSATAAVVTLDNDLSALPTINDGYSASAILFPSTTYDHICTSGGGCLPPDSVGGAYRSPYELPNGSGMEDGYAGTPFTSVRGGSVAYNFATGQTGLSILWGSPDSYNTLEFWSGQTLADGTTQGSLLGTIIGSALGDPQALGHHYMTFGFDDSSEFLSIVLRSTTAAFEFAALTTSGPAGEAQLPLPPALILFGSALVGLVTLGRRRRQGAAT